LTNWSGIPQSKGIFTAEKFAYAANRTILFLILYRGRRYEIR
jgi:hypothetical protein